MTVVMKTCMTIGIACIVLARGGVAMPESATAQNGERLAQAPSKTICVQVISCGTKDGKVKEYPTPCDARDDGATNVHPKTGSACDAAR
jgi:hypothetical protein